MTDDGERTRLELIEQFLEERAEVPSSRLARLAQSALSGFRAYRLLGKRREEEGEIKLKPEDVARFVTSVGQLKGVAMKAGQIMSYIDVALPEEARNALSVLQTHAQPMETERVRAILKAELGDKGEFLASTLEDRPVSAASIGQVHRAFLPDDTPVAVKVQYPDIEDAIRSDFSLAQVGTRIANLIYPGASVEEFVEEAKKRFLEECDYEAEANAQERFAHIYQDHPLLKVPAVHREYCSQRVLTSTFIDAPGFHSFLQTDPTQQRRDEIGEALFEFYVGTLFREGLYNCDPHPGNYLFPEDGHVVMLDHGCTKVFPSDFVDKIARLTLAVHADDSDEIHEVLVNLGIVETRQDYDYETARDLLRAFYGPMLENEKKAIDLSGGLGMQAILERKRQLMQLSLPGEFLFLFRIRFGLMSVLDELGATANWHQLEESYVNHRIS